MQFISQAIVAWTKSLDGQCLAVTDGYVAQTGVPRSVIEGSTVGDVFPRDVAAKMERMDAEAIEYGESGCAISLHGILWRCEEYIVGVNGCRRIVGIAMKAH